MVSSTNFLLYCFLMVVLDAYTSPINADLSLDFATTRRRCAGQRAPRSVDAEVQYAVVIDAGSSGSRVRIYRWPDDQHQAMTGIRSVKPTLEIDTGLAQVADNETEVGSHIERLILNASGQVPRSEHASTPIYFMATAGRSTLAHFHGHVIKTSSSSLSSSWDL